jgi:hypothetical protein
MEKCCGDNSSELIVAHQLFGDAERFAGVMAVQRRNEMAGKNYDSHS